MSNVTTTATTATAEYVQFTRQKGKGITTVTRAVEGVNRGASAAVLAGALKGQARAAVVEKGASEARKAIAMGLADTQGWAYQLAFFTVATLANVTTVASVDELGKVNRAGWLECKRDIFKAHAELVAAGKGSTPAGKAMAAALALWGELQGMADTIRAEKAAKVTAQVPARVDVSTLTPEQADKVAADTGKPAWMAPAEQA